MNKKQINQKSVGYEGNVTLKVCKGNKVIKTIKQNNSGVGRLFHGIALGLISGFVDDNLINYTPKYLGVGRTQQLVNINTDYNANTLQSAESGIMIRVKLEPNNAYNREGLGWVAPFSAIVPSSQLQTLNYQVNELGLFSSANTDSLLARIVPTNKSGDSEPIVVEPGMDLIVQWEILIQNK